MVHGRKPIRRLDSVELDESRQSVDGSQDSEFPNSEISLEDLGNAFADAMRMERPTLHLEPEPADSEIDYEPTNSASEVAHVTPAAILEALLFVGTRSGEPVATETLTQVLKDFSAEEIASLVTELNADYATHGHPFQIVSLENAYAMRLENGFEAIHDVLASNTKETRLNQNAIDCLALVAYQPGITKEGIETQWGQPVGHVLSYLVRKGLLRLDSTSEEVALESSHQAKRYFTTDRFLAILGVDSLEDLPRGDEL